ncbi:MAG TPA: TIGR03905 family protein [Elusimicrobia bacterium]|nr:MAG: TIGR03905 family protein [Elusimicrobia bacterium GWF2_62_30]HBA61598.1 TIGR03905 family protein [Elusimicrobiota bacterium]
MRRKLKDVCAKSVAFRVVGGRLEGVKFYSGCPGNLQALGALLEGMPVEEAVAKLKGIPCGERKTSCSDQLARVLEARAKPAARRKPRKKSGPPAGP